jgi:HPr kinase/phosphorylase
MRTAAEATAEPEGSEQLLTGRAFGLTLTGTRPLSGMIDGASPGGRIVRYSLADAQDIEGEWPASESEVLVERHNDDGSLFLSVSHHPVAGYRVDAPGHGLHLLSAGGERLMLSLPPGAPWVWQRLLFAQTLPIAARLHGLTLLHAAAVSLGGVVALTGPSGSGKSSVALQLAALGPPFFSDDVVALEEREGQVVAHPGPRFANVHAHELSAVPAEARLSLGQTVGESDRLHLEPEGEARALPFRALYLLRRVDGDGPVRVEPVVADPLMLLGSGFLPRVRVPDQEVRDLELFGLLAGAGRTFAVSVPTSVTARDVAATVLEHAEESA